MKTLCSKISNSIKGLIKRNQRYRTSELADGTNITRPFSYVIVIFSIVLIVFLYFWNMIITDFFNRFGFRFFITRVPNFFTIIQKMIVQVNWSYFDKVVQPLIDTIQISIIGTVVGSLLALPVAIIASQNIMGKSRIPSVVKFFLSIININDCASLKIDLYDKGVPAIPTNIRPRNIEDIKPGGLGTFFIGQIMDEVMFKTSATDWVNHLILIKNY